MTLLSIGDEVREGTYKLHSRFDRAVNFTDGRRLVTLVTPDIGAGPVNIVVRDLTPAQAALLDRDQVRAVVLAHGSPSSHAAILARSRGIPAIAGAGVQVLSLVEGTEVIVDGTGGVLIIDPDPMVLAGYQQRSVQLAAREQAERQAAQATAISRDGHRVMVEANIGSVADAVTAAELGADGVGLVRTEFLFLGRDQAPGVGEQEKVYRAVAEALGRRPVVFRTLDVGGDKPLTYLPMPDEENPFLGVRGLRLTLSRPDLLRGQLLALARVAVDHPVAVMFPMVSTPAELLDARGVLDDVLSELASSGAGPVALRVGMMAEVPAAALQFAAFAEHVDFVSIGTNDLTQYTMAAERGNTALAALSDPLDPGVLRLIDQVCRSGREGISIAVCGEAASDPAAVPVLLGLGVHELSVTPYSVPAVKAQVRMLDLARCAELARACLDLPDAGAVRALVTARNW